VKRPLSVILFLAFFSENLVLYSSPFSQPPYFVGQARTEGLLLRKQTFAFDFLAVVWEHLNRRAPAEVPLVVLLQKEKNEKKGSSTQLSPWDNNPTTTSHTHTHTHTLTPFATFYATGNHQNKFKRELTLSAAWFRG